MVRFVLTVVCSMWVGQAIPDSRQRWCANGIDFRTRNGEIDRVAMEYRLCMDRSKWMWRQELDCKPSDDPHKIPLAGCNITGMHETTIVNRTHSGRIQPIAPGKVTCNLSPIPQERQCMGAWQDASDCDPGCGGGESCCKDPAVPSGVQGACYKVSSCSELLPPACAGEPFSFMVTDAGSTKVGKETMQGVDVDHWASTRLDKKNITKTMHYYFRSAASPDGSQPLLRTAFEQHFDKRPGDGGHNITQVGIRDWSANYTDDISDSTFMLFEAVVPEEADDACKEVIAMEGMFFDASAVQV